VAHRPLTLSTENPQQFNGDSFFLIKRFETLNINVSRLLIKKGIIMKGSQAKPQAGNATRGRRNSPRR
jgi:hypothetical protein